ncbi:rubrerythrin [Clostridium ihumii]|uniref:rubrerythrin n=1 Tax=Clostridium ihumii TaxID=1470356 RepID=UPI000552BC50|nr:rubrerythrin family protein [Clostridium ihumii]
MKSLKGSKTETNLMRAFAGESQARNRYTFYADVAKQEKYEYIEHIFTETAQNEKAHAKVFFDLLNNGLGEDAQVDVDGKYPVAIGKTMDNLKYAAAGEHDEWTHAYPEFERIATEEGYPEVAAAFKKIIEVEKKHDERYTNLYDLMKSGKLYKRDEKEVWRCRNCGYIYEGEEAPKVCPLCHYPQGYYEKYYGIEQ